MILILGIVLGAFIMSQHPFEKKTDLELAKEKLEEFKEMEKLCGKGNVISKCSNGYCKSGIGITCYIWRKAAHEAEKLK